MKGTIKASYGAVIGYGGHYKPWKFNKTDTLADFCSPYLPPNKIRLRTLQGDLGGCYKDGSLAEKVTAK